MPQKDLKFSVIIATFNRREYALTAVRSVKQQSFPAHEIILVVDGSEDGTANAVRHEHPDVIVHEQSNLGPSVAHNTGIALSTGNWICFLDDDDLWHTEKLAICADFIHNHPDCQALRHLIWLFTESEVDPAGGYGFARDFVAATLEECHASISNGRQSVNDFSCLYIEGNSFGRLLERNLGTLSASLVRRDTIIRAGCFCPMQTCGDDWTMFVNVARMCEWHTIRRRLGFTRLHANQNTTDARNGLYTLAGQVNAWYTGRPLPNRATQDKIRAELLRYASSYRAAVQTYYWAALRDGQFRLARSIRTMGRLLLPRLRDYLYVLLPPPLTWRWQRYVARNFRERASSAAQPAR